MTPAAKSNPSGSEESANISWNWFSWEATAIAARNPANMAAPPSEGVGSRWTLRFPGIDIAPMRGARRRMTNVNRNVVSAPTAPTTE